MGTLWEKQLILPVLPVPHKVGYQDDIRMISCLSAFGAEKREAEQWPYTVFCFYYFILFSYSHQGI